MNNRQKYHTQRSTYLEYYQINCNYPVRLYYDIRNLYKKITGLSPHPQTRLLEYGWIKTLPI